jgi:hypothetical protein
MTEVINLDNQETTDEGHARARTTPAPLGITHKSEVARLTPMRASTAVRLAVLSVRLAVRLHQPPSGQHRKDSTKRPHCEPDREPYIDHHRDTNQRPIAFSLHDTSTDANHLKARLTPPDLIGLPDGSYHRLEPPLSESSTKRPKPHCSVSWRNCSEASR